MATVSERELKMADFYVFAVWNVRNALNESRAVKYTGAYPLCFSPLTLVFRTHASQCIHKLHLILSALWTEPVNRRGFTTSIRHMLVYGMKEAPQIITINNTNMLQYQGSSLDCSIRNHLTLWIPVFFIFLMGWDWVHLVLRPLFGLLYQPRMIDDCGAIGGMRIRKGDWSTRRNLPQCHFVHHKSQVRTRAAAVGSRRLTAGALAGQSQWLLYVKVELYLYRPWRPVGLREVDAPTFSGIRLADGGEVVSPTRRPFFTPRKIPGTHFC
jgi:hypothetical protein